MSKITEMYVKEFNADLGELSLSLEGSKHWRRFNASRIDKIKKTQGTRKRLFFEKKVGRLEISVNADENLYVIQEDKLKDDFEWVSGVIKKFAEKNKVEYEIA